ncbi:hypothetical protein [Herbaspirillum huttiense]|uniref:hypothetical protein n=1 Tax=Herbaspirillum huttiense TaxID=863372 RepID=UPI002E75B4F9|nr:hypothetical protein [Herbaspirillum huttiense]MEE1637159.1 hypothetical protein [Herbaspirillum huttiense NC40101]
MGTGVELVAYAALASAAVGTYSAIQQGNQAKDQANYQAAQAQADADAAAGQAEVEAAQIRKATLKQRAAARSALADSGVNVDVGSAELVQSDIQQQGEQDALTTILNGNNARAKLNSQADAFQIAGSNAQTAGYLRGASSALSAFGRTNGWKTKNPSASTAFSSADGSL